MNKVVVCFEYDESSRRWDVFVSGVSSDVEAKQAFNAVVITAQEAKVTMEHKVDKRDEGYYHLSSIAI